MGTFLNAVKNLINSLTAKTSSTASTADMVQLHDANGNPNGKISLADLASVLGGIRTTLENGEDLDGLTNEGKYRATKDAIAQSCHNSPSRVGFIMNVYNGSYSVVQQVIPFNGGTIYMRRYHRSQGIWSSWYKYTGEQIEL